MLIVITDAVTAIPVLMAEHASRYVTSTTKDSSAGAGQATQGHIAAQVITSI